MKSAWKRAAVETEAKPDEIPTLAPSSKRIASDTRNHLSSDHSHSCERWSQQQMCFPSCGIRRHESTVDLSVLLFGSTFASNSASPAATDMPAHPPPLPMHSPSRDAPQAEGSSVRAFSKNVTPRRLVRSDPGIAPQAASRKS